MNNLSKKYFDDAPYSIFKTKLSFINRLFSHDQVLLICQIFKSTENLTSFNSPTLPQEESKMDVTGSPLKHSLIDPTFEISIFSTKRNWYKDEERYHPIGRKDALEYITCLKDKIQSREKNDENFGLPIFAIINPNNDNQGTVLLGCHFQQSKMHTYLVTQHDLVPLSKFKNDYEYLITKHLEESFHPKHYQVLINSSYELLGIDSRMIDQSIKDFSGFLKIDISWNTSSFTPPSVTLSNNLISEIVGGSTSTYLDELWREILLVNKYLTILDNYYKNNTSSRYSIECLNFPENFSTPFFQTDEEIKYKLNCLLTGNNYFQDKNSKSIAQTVNVKLTDVLRELPTRPNIDFIDNFWAIIRSTDNYKVMADCIYDIFDLVIVNNCKLQLNDMNETRFSKLLSNITASQKKMSLHAGALSLELIIDMALKKLYRDYTYLLSSMNLLNIFNLHEIIIDIYDEFKIQNYREKLIKIAEVHIALEFLQLIQSKFNCRNHISQFIFKSALKVAKDNLTFDDTIYKMNIPTPKEFMSQIVDTTPSTWMLNISSSGKLQTSSTIHYFSQSSIFPPNIYTLSDQVLESLVKSGENMYHSTSAKITSFNLK